jgi:hypothetical protein
MKLRIKGSSLRLRLTQSEVQQLDAQAEVADRVQFGGGAALTYKLRRDGDNQAITVSYTNNVIEILIPERRALEWCRTDQVTLAHSQPLAEGEELHIAVEKDFACLAPRTDEDESDHFPHPQAGTGATC